MRISDLLHRAPTIRQWLGMLLAACMVPATIAVTVLFIHSYQRERSGIELATLDVARALMEVIDRELASAQGAMQALATSPNLASGDLEAFYGQASATLQQLPGNVLVLSDRHGRQIVDTHMPFGAPLPFHGNPRQLQRVIETGKAAVSDVYTDPTVKRRLTSVDVPVLRGGRVQYVLSMQYFGERLGEILERQKIPPDAAASILDRAGVVVWGNRQPPGEAAEHATSAETAGLALADEGIVDERGPDGIAYVTVFSRSSVSNWAVVIGLKRSALSQELWKSMAWIASGTLALIALGLVLVSMIGGRVAASVRGLVGPAIALGYGAPVSLPRLHLREAKDVGQALVQGALLLRERTAQRDAAASAEQSLREANRAIEQSEAFLRGIFEETPDAVFLVGADCRVVRVNTQAEQLFGYAQGQLAGLPVDALLFLEQPGGQHGVCDELLATPERGALDGGARLRGRRRDGAAFPADAMASRLVAGGAALLIVTVRDVTESWRKEEALRGALNDKNTLLKELYHRVKNNLQLINSLFNLQVRSLPEGDARAALLEAAGRVRAMALVHERLYQSRTLSSIALDEYVGELCTQLARAASAERRGIVPRVEVEPIEIGLDAALPLGLLLNELVSNSLKHGFPDGRAGAITVRIARADGELARLTVADDGVGLPPGFDQTNSQSLGLKLITALSDQLRGKFTLESRDGVRATLLFKLGAPASAPGAALRE